MYDLKVEKMIAKNSKDVFKALQEGKLFMNCSADSNSLEIDFKVGGKYKINFKNHKVSNWGEFLEIIPNKKIVFTWCQTFGLDQKPDTKVTIELFPEGVKTKLILEHQGFYDQSTCDDHYQGWNGGLTDLISEMENGQIRMVRGYDAPVEKLMAMVLESKDLFGTIKETSNNKIILDTNTTLLFSAKNENRTSLEIIKIDLLSERDIEKNRKNWDAITSKLTELLG